MSNLFDEQANEYDEWFRVNDKLYDTEVSAVKSMLDDDREYIEVGIGTGLFASRLGIKRGVEPSDEMSKYAVARGLDVKKAVAENLPYDSESVDGLVMITVDCFVKDIRPVFSEAYRVLSNNGSYVLAFLDKGSPLGKCYEENKENDVYYKDATFRTADEMRDYLKEAGFKIENSCNTVMTLNNEIQPIVNGSGEGVFAIIKARKEI